MKILISLMLLSFSVMAQDMVQGTVIKTIDVDNYTYVEVKTANGPVWAAVTKAQLKKGADVTIGNGMMMDNFDSKGLKRKFDKIYFGELTGANAKADAVAAAHAGSKSQKVAMDKIKVEKAKDGKSIAEVYKERGTLNGKMVTVRGKVVKFNGGIMGKNWVHLQDGTGKVDSKDFDLTVTTQDIFKVGDVVTIKGAVVTDKDFGAGYFFPVIIENGSKL